MPENTLPPSERTVVVNQTRLGILTVVSLCFNALILLLLLIGLIGDHHHRPDRDYGPPREWQGGQERDDMRFRHQDWGGGGPGWSHGPRFERGEESRMEGSDRGPGEFQGSPNPGEGFERAEGLESRHPATPSEMTDRLMQHLTRQLGLTDQESTQIRPVIEQQVAQFQKDMETQRQARTKAIDDATAKIRPMLNADQQKQLDQFKAAMDQKVASPAPDATGPAKSKSL